MLPGDYLQVSASRNSVAQGIDDSSKGAGPRDISRVSPALGATLVAQRGWGVSVTPRPLFTPGKDPVPIV
jgi:hypothetical protein